MSFHAPLLTPTYAPATDPFHRLKPKSHQLTDTTFFTGGSPQSCVYLEAIPLPAYLLSRFHPNYYEIVDIPGRIPSLATIISIVTLDAFSITDIVPHSSLDSEKPQDRDIDAATFPPRTKTARDQKRDHIRHARGYHQKITTTTARVVRKPVQPGTAQFYEVILREWDLFLTEYDGCWDPTNLKTFKDFILYFAEGRRDRNEPGGPLTEAYVVTVWKCFIAAWGRRHHVSFSKSHQDTILNFIKGGEEGSPNLTRKTRPKRNFTRDDFLVCITQLWQNDWHDFDHERYRVGLHLLLLLHYNTSARRAEYEREWRYTDITLTVVWLNSATQPQLVIDFQRNKAKGLQKWESEQPQHMLYELVNLPFYCNSILFFVAAVLADDVLRDYHSWDEICTIPQPQGQKHMILEWHPDKRHWPVFPRCPRWGQLDHNRTSVSLTSRALVNLGRRAGFKDNLTLHAARREVLLQVDNYGYSCNERMRFAAHVNADTYRWSYQTSIPLVDGQASYFQFQASGPELHDLRRSYGWQRDPLYLPKLREATRLVECEVTDEDDKDASPVADIVDEKKRQQKYDRRRHQRDLLIRAQTGINSLPNSHEYESDFHQTRKLMPERDRLATSLFGEGSLRDEIGRGVMNDLIALCRSAAPKTYCPGLNSSERMCDTCSTQCHDNQAPKWWSHLYRCRKQFALKKGGFAEFCFLCFQWFEDKVAWDEHAEAHLRNPPLKCSMAMFRHNVVRPAMCPACLGDGKYRQYLNGTTWKSHLQDHVLGRQTQTCPHPRCGEVPAMASKVVLLNHLADVHDIRFESKKRQKALALDELDLPGDHRQTFEFVHIDADQCSGTSTHIERKTSTRTSKRVHWKDDVEMLGRQDDGASANPTLEEASYPKSSMEGGSQNDLHDTGLITDDVNLVDGDVNNLSGHLEPPATRLKTLDRTPVRDRPHITVIVPPVPDSWNDIPIMTDVDEGSAMSTVTERRKQATLKRGRPPGSKNNKTLLRDRGPTRPAMKRDEKTRLKRGRPPGSRNRKTLVEEHRRMASASTPII